ncbi:MAG: hypothetical protein WCL32_24620 [Planctomycetota bacterium]
MPLDETRSLQIVEKRGDVRDAVCGGEVGTSLAQEAGQFLGGGQFSQSIPKNGRRFIQELQFEGHGMEKNQRIVQSFFVDAGNFNEVSGDGNLRQNCSQASN